MGYCLDTYKHMSRKEINSQVNKQVNAGSVSFNGPSELYIYLFISVKNMDIERKLEVSSTGIK